MAPQKIGVIAGGGQFPLLFIKAAQRAGRIVHLIAHRSETADSVAAAADDVCWIKLGQLGKIINYFKKSGVTETVFLGTITKTQIFRDVLPDFKALSLWNKIDAKQDDAILRAVARSIESEGITVRESTLYLEHLLFPKGILTKKKPTREQWKDIEFGWQNARAVGRLDIGQCVVVRDCTVVAVEAIEGTDATIKRGGTLAKEKAVVVKLKKPNQDFRFDLPATGIGTIESIQGVKGALLAVEAGQSLLFDREKMIAAADRAGIVVIGLAEDRSGKLSYS